MDPLSEAAMVVRNLPRQFQQSNLSSMLNRELNSCMVTAILS